MAEWPRNGGNQALERCISLGQVADIRCQCDTGLSSSGPVADTRRGRRRGRLATAASTTPTAGDQVTCDAAEVGVDDEIQDEVDGEVGQQKEVGDVRGRLERPVVTQPGGAASR